jgi:hypothetical protein
LNTIDLHSITFYLKSIIILVPFSLSSSYFRIQRYPYNCNLSASILPSPQVYSCNANGIAQLTSPHSHAPPASLQPTLDSDTARSQCNRMRLPRPYPCGIIYLNDKRDTFVAQGKDSNWRQILEGSVFKRHHSTAVGNSSLRKHHDGVDRTILTGLKLLYPIFNLDKNISPTSPVAGSSVHIETLSVFSDRVKSKYLFDLHL